MHGICYLSNDTEVGSKINWKRIKPLINLKDQFFDVIGKHYRSPKFMFGEMGISAHMTKGGKTILIGAPGIWDWSGSFVHLVQNKDRQWTTVVANPTQWRQPKFSYFGYALTSGRFYQEQKERELLVASAPRAAETFGEVYVFSIDQIQWQGNISIVQTLRGHQMGEYFGYALVADDFNGDDKSELVVAAPLNAMDDSYDNGKVYVYSSSGGKRLELVTVLVPTGSVGHAVRFGTALSQIGDLNGDRYNGKFRLVINCIKLICLKFPPAYFYRKKCD